MRKIAFWIGIFAIVVGWLTYDPEVATATMPVITGFIVVALAVFDLIPEFVVCVHCGRKSPKKKPHCLHCGEQIKIKN